MIRDSVEEALRSAQGRTTAASGPAGAAGTLATGKSPGGSTKLKKKLKKKVTREPREVRAARSRGQ